VRIIVLCVAVTLLQAVAALAQPSISAEVVSDPLPFRQAALTLPVPGIAMARDRSGVAIAWSMPGADERLRIHVARLDTTGHINGSIQAIPPFSPLPSVIDAVYPSMAPSPSGDGFTLGWLEVKAPISASQSPAVTTGYAVYCQLNAALKPSPSSVFVEGVTSPAIVRSGKAMWITAGGTLFQVQGDAPLTIPFSSLIASDMTAAMDFPQVVSSREDSTDFTCMPRPDCRAGGGPFRGYCYESCRIYNHIYELRFLSVYILSSATTFAFTSEGAPAVQSDGRDVLMAWFRGEQKSGGQVVAARLQPRQSTDFPRAAQDPQILGEFGPDAGSTRPDIATDGERYVVVWRTTSPKGDHDIVGAALDTDGKVTPFSIATSTADEKDPSILSLGGGMFLVAYEKFIGDERRLAGRFVTFGSRRRATH
jgi:hypothetical protein